MSNRAERWVLFIVVVILSTATAITSYFLFDQVSKTNNLSKASVIQSRESKRISVQNRKLNLMNRKLANDNRKLIVQVRVIAKQGEDAHDALCIVRRRLARDISRGTKFLKEHPEGIPGIPSKLIVEGITSDRTDLKALRGLHCS